NAVIEAKRQLQAPAEAIAFESNRGGEGQVVDALKQLVNIAHVAAQLVDIVGGIELAHVGADDEGLWLARHQHQPGGVVGFEPVDNRLQFRENLRTQAVDLFIVAVEVEPGNAVEIGFQPPVPSGAGLRGRCRHPELLHSGAYGELITMHSAMCPGVADQGRSTPKRASSATTRVSGRPISAVGSSLEMRSVRAIPSASLFMAPAQSKGRSVST